MATFILGDNSLTVYHNGTPHTIPSDSLKFQSCLNALKAKDDKALEVALQQCETVTTVKVDGQDTSIRVTPDGVFLNNKPVHNEVGNRIVQYNAKGIPYDSLVKFLENLYTNPVFDMVRNAEVRNMLKLSEQQAEKYVDETINDMWQFLSANGHAITEDGCFLAYKAVCSDLLDKHTRTVYNGIGSVIEMDRAGVDPNRDNECSHGYHVGNIGYVDGFGSGSDVKLIVKVNPRDVVRVPRHDSTKMRVCRYEVLAKYEQTLTAPAYRADVNEIEAVPSDYSASDYWNRSDEHWDNDDIYDGAEISFQYEGKFRYLSVEDTDSTSVSGILLEPEENSGSYRRFKKDKMSKISSYTVDHEDDDDDEDFEDDDDDFEDDDDF